MRVIKPGTKPFDTQLEIPVNCPTCTAHFVVETINDAYRVTSGSDMRAFEDYPVVICPCCSQHIQLKERDFPANVYKHIAVR